MNLHVIGAIFRRNFISYFNNPTGYVFICVFVLLSGIAAFWPHEFFNANLANLDQLNKALPFIMLIFIPAITMSIWADERRQGTDELLLTIPATDFDVVLGKYLAAVAIFTVALLFSLISNLLVLLTLGQPDLGLFLANYLGYWMVGLAMLAIGMVASFLTSNLTVAFVLGVLFNAPLALAGLADVILPNTNAVVWAKRWSLAGQFQDFSRGVISLGSVMYFLMIVVVALYVCMVLIGRRHWAAGRGGQSMGGHFLARSLALVLVAFGLASVAGNTDVRIDLTTERLSSLSPDTRRLMSELDPKRPVKIEAFISNSVPEAYVQTKLNLETMLRELEAMSSGKIKVRVNYVEPLSEEAAIAEQKYGIKKQQVMTRSRGAFREEDVVLGAAFTSGLDKVVVPFFDRGLPVEYELIRSVCTVSQQKRQRLGVVKTDAELFGGMDMATFSPRPKSRLIEELEKQYEVVQVDPNSPIVERFDVMLAVQPSSLNPAQMQNFLAAVRSGQPTAIFEDPFPYLSRNVAGTAQPRRQQQSPMMMFQPPQQEPKGDINELWKLLGVELVATRSGGGRLFGGGSEPAVIWQAYNPYPKAQGFRRITREWVFVSPGAPEAGQPFNEEDPISSNFQQLLLLYPGAIAKQNTSNMEFTPLVSTGKKTGEVSVEGILTSAENPYMMQAAEKPTNKAYVVAARIQGEVDPGKLLMADDKDKGDEAKPTANGKATEEAVTSNAAEADKEAKPEAEPAKKPAPSKIDVVLVSDMDLLSSEFFALRAWGVDDEVQWDFDNVPFVLNVLDVLANDDRFVDIRKRRPQHRTLVRVDDQTQIARDAAAEEKAKFSQQMEEELVQANQSMEKAINDLETKIEKLKKQGSGSAREVEQAVIELALKREVEGRRLQIKKQQLERERDTRLEKIERDLALDIRHTQDSYKTWAVLLPPIPPLLLACFVYFHRRAREREGVAKSRLR